MGLCKEQLVDKAFCVCVYRLVLDWHYLDSSCHFYATCSYLLKSMNRTSADLQLPGCEPLVYSMGIWKDLLSAPADVNPTLRGTFPSSPSLSSLVFLTHGSYPATSRWVRASWHSQWYHVCFGGTRRTLLSCWVKIETAGRRVFPQFLEVNSCRCQQAHRASVNGSSF